MSPTPIRDPNLPGDPAELRDIPDHQHMGDAGVGQPHNPVLPGAPPSPDYPTGVPPVEPEEPPIESLPPPDGGGGETEPPPIKPPPSQKPGKEEAQHQPAKKK